MDSHAVDEAAHPTTLRQLPLRVREKPSIAIALSSAKDGSLKHSPEPLQLSTSARIRSPTQSSLSSRSSHSTRSTTASLSSLASPLSSAYTSDIHDTFPFPGSRPASRILHRHQPSNGTCSTFVNDEDDMSVVATYPSFADKIPLPEPYEIRPSTRESDETLPVSPSTEGPLVKEEEPEPRLTFYEESTRSESPPQVQKWETQSAASDDDGPPEDDASPEDADSILDYALQLAYGVDVDDTSMSPADSRRVVHRFIRELGQTMWHAAPGSQHTNTTVSGSTSSSSTPGSGGTGGSQRGGKRKKQSVGGSGGAGGGGGGGRGGDDDGDDMSDGSGDGSGFLPIKRARPNPKDDDTNLRLSCPFRKRNPGRFNVRDHHSCAMTFFPKFAELRQHIVKQHKRDDPSAFVCGRCNRDFATRRELHHHQRLPREEMCDIADHDPESGIDGSTSTKLLSRKRASGTSPEVQWREIWNIVFPEDDDHLVPSYHFTPVIEHFELSSSYLVSFDTLRCSLRDKMSNPATLETLATKFHQCFVEAMERCIADAQTMPYANRSNKRNEQLAAAAAASAAQPRGKIKDALPRPDSGVVMTDDGSDESGSVLGGPLAQRESIGTVRAAPHRASNLSSSSLSAAREIAPAHTSSSSVMFDASSSSSLALAPASTTAMSGSLAPSNQHVDAWSQGVMFPGHQQGVPDGFVVRPQDLSLPPQQQQLDDWGQSFYDAGSGTRSNMGNDFTGYF